MLALWSLGLEVHNLALHSDSPICLLSGPPLLSPVFLTREMG